MPRLADVSSTSRKLDTAPASLDDYPDMLTVDEAAAILRIGRFAVYDAVKRGQIPGMKIGRSLRISKAQLREMMEGRKE